MTKLEYYNLLINTSLSGGFPAAEPDSDGKLHCKYRCVGGRKCVAGLLIPDCLYKPYMEGHNIRHGIVNEAVEYPDGVNFTMLTSIQDLHDDFSISNAMEWDHEKFKMELDKIMGIG